MHSTSAPAGSVHRAASGETLSLTVLTLLLLLSQIEIRSHGRVVTPRAPVVHPRVLFLGNSLTYYNEMPWMLEQIAKSKNEPLSAVFVGRSGETLRQHWQETRAIEAIRARTSDFVVLQPQSTEIIRDPDTAARYARLLNEEIRKSGAKTILFLTWAPLDQPAPQAEFTRRSAALARDLGAIVAPVGVAWERLQKIGVPLFDGDVHPNVAGSYLEACVFFAIVTGKNPAGATYTFDVHFDIPEFYRRSLEQDRIDAATAAAIQRAAWDAVQEYRASR